MVMILMAGKRQRTIRTTSTRPAEPHPTWTENLIC
jgi:hypothetical protein